MMHNCKSIMSKHLLLFHQRLYLSSTVHFFASYESLVKCTIIRTPRVRVWYMCVCVCMMYVCTCVFVCVCVRVCSCVCGVYVCDWG